MAFEIAVLNSETLPNGVTVVFGVSMAFGVSMSVNSGENNKFKDKVSKYHNAQID